MAAIPPMPGTAWEAAGNAKVILCLQGLQFLNSPAVRVIVSVVTGPVNERMSAFQTAPVSWFPDVSPVNPALMVNDWLRVSSAYRSAAPPEPRHHWVWSVRSETAESNVVVITSPQGYWRQSVEPAKLSVSGRGPVKNLPCPRWR